MFTLTGRHCCNSLKKSGPLNSQLTKSGNKTPSIHGVEMFPWAPVIAMQGITIYRNAEVTD
jgi:hypothetical protein